MIYLECPSRVCQFRRQYPHALYISVMENGCTEFRKLSPKFEWGDIPIPYSYGMTAKSVFAVCKLLEMPYEKVLSMKLDQAGKSMKEGRVFYRRGMAGDYIYNIFEARKYIYFPTYKWMLENRAYKFINYLRKYNEGGDIVLIDKHTNYDINDVSKP